MALVLVSCSSTPSDVVATETTPSSTAPSDETTTTTSEAEPPPTTGTTAPDAVPPAPADQPSQVAVSTFQGTMSGRCILPQTVFVPGAEGEPPPIDQVAQVAFGGLHAMTQLGQDTSRGSQASLNYYPWGSGGGTVLETSLDGDVVTVDVADDWLDRWPAEAEPSLPPCYLEDLSAVRLGHGVLTMLEVDAVTGVRVLIDGSPHPEAGDGQVLGRADVLSTFGGLVLTSLAVSKGEPMRLVGFADLPADISWRVVDHASPGDPELGRGEASLEPQPDGTFRFEVAASFPPCAIDKRELTLEQPTETGEARSISIPLAHDAAVPNC